MNETGNSGAGEGVSEVKSAMAGFVHELKGFQSDIEERLQQQEEKMTMFERKSFVPARPVLAGGNDGPAPHQKAFNAYLRSGDDDGLRGLELEGKALGTSVAGDGGYLPPSGARAAIFHALSSCSPPSEQRWVARA